MENTFWTALGASSLAALVTTIGIYVIRHFERWGRENITYFICFAAGVLISVSFLHIIPTAFSMNTNAPVYLFAGYTSLYIFNRFINAFICDKTQISNTPWLWCPCLASVFTHLSMEFELTGDLGSQKYMAGYVFVGRRPVKRHLFSSTVVSFPDTSFDRLSHQPDLLVLLYPPIFHRSV